MSPNEPERSDAVRESTQHSERRPDVRPLGARSVRPLGAQSLGSPRNAYPLWFPGGPVV